MEKIIKELELKSYHQILFFYKNINGSNITDKNRNYFESFEQPKASDVVDSKTALAVAIVSQIIEENILDNELLDIWNDIVDCFEVAKNKTIDSKAEIENLYNKNPEWYQSMTEEMKNKILFPSIFGPEIFMLRHTDNDSNDMSHVINIDTLSQYTDGNSKENKNLNYDDELVMTDDEPYDDEVLSDDEPYDNGFKDDEGLGKCQLIINSRHYENWKNIVDPIINLPLYTNKSSEEDYQIIELTKVDLKKLCKEANERVRNLFNSLVSESKQKSNELGLTYEICSELFKLCVNTNVLLGQ